ncbi:MAG TPA: tetratricopeptide repeat protein [Kiritimatiellia bacterium]|nr:tetratricopeptide repeat protein [Kiritimatiellia bacterium]
MFESNNISGGPETPGSKPGVTKSTIPGLRPDDSDDVRITVQSLEDEIKKQSHVPAYSNSRSRRNRRKEESSGKYLWISVFGVAILYLGALGFQITRQRSASHEVTPPPSIPVLATAIQSDGGVSESVLPVESGLELPNDVPASTVRIADVIADLKKSRQLLDDGRRLARERKAGMAEDKLQEAVKLAPYQGLILIELGRVLMEEKRWADARDVLIRAIMADPDSASARMMLAKVFVNLRQLDEALAMARWILESEPYSEDAHQIAADAYTQLEEHDNAIQHWQRLVALNSNNHVAENNLGAAYLKSGKLNQAIRTFENVIRNEPGNSQAYYYLALAFIAKNEPELAAGVLVRASDRFGLPFVFSWSHGAEFDSVRGVALFQRHFNELIMPRTE